MQQQDRRRRRQAVLGHIQFDRAVKNLHDRHNRQSLAGTGVLAQTLKTKRRTNEAQEPAARTVDAVSLQLKDRSMRRPKKAHYVHQLGLYSVAAPDICGRISPGVHHRQVSRLPCSVLFRGSPISRKRQSAMGGTNVAVQQQRAGSITVSLGGFGPNQNVSRSHWPDHQDRQPGQVTIVARGASTGQLVSARYSHERLNRGRKSRMATIRP